MHLTAHVIGAVPAATQRVAHASISVQPGVDEQAWASEQQ
jgi:hypothetical protein